MNERPKVVYVMGTGRSGSTILGITLGNCERIFYAGELNLWIGKQGRSPVRDPDRQRFWDGVRERVDVPLWFPRKRARRLEKSADLLRVWNWRSQRRLRPEYRRITEDLFRAVAEQAGATHVVDTSHFPRRARELHALEGIDLYLLFVVRDARNVVASYSREEEEFARFNVPSTNAYLWLSYVLSLFVFWRHPRGRRLVVRYEDFLTDPASVMGDILRCIDSPAANPDFGALDTGLSFQGNPTLRSGVVALEAKPSRAVRGSLLTRLLNLPLALVLSRLRPVAGSGSGSGEPCSG